MKKFIILLIAFMSITSLLHAQSTVSYGYDAAGNRISRVIVINPSPSPASPDEQPIAVYSELFKDIELKIYPNPTDGLLKVEIHNLPEKETAQIWLYDLSGKLISSRKDVKGYTDINISGQPQGTYLMKIVAGEYRKEWKIIKK